MQDFSLTNFWPTSGFGNHSLNEWRNQHTRTQNRITKGRNIQMAKTQKKSQKQMSQEAKGASGSQTEQTQDQRLKSDTLARRESSRVASPSRDSFMLMRILSADLDRMAENFGFGRSFGLRDLMQQGRSGLW